MNEPVVHWYEMELFEGIDLNDSFVLDWYIEETRLRFCLELSVWPTSQFYFPPRPDEYTCYRLGTLTFLDYESFCGLKAQSDTPSSKDPDNGIDYGSIDALYRSGTTFSLNGDFGNVSIYGGSIILHVDGFRNSRATIE